MSNKEKFRMKSSELNDIFKDDTETEQDSPLYTQDEAAAYLRVSRNTLRSLCLPQTRINRRLFFRKDILDRYIEDHTVASFSN